MGTDFGKICVTGASGLVGRQVCNVLVSEGYEVIPTSLHGENACDLLDPVAACSFLSRIKPDILIHLAWHTGAGYARSQRNLSWLKAGKELVRTFYGLGGRRFVGVGTCFEYKASTLDLSETTSPVVPDTLYGQSKLELLEYLRAHAEGSSWAWARLFYLSGPGDIALHRLVPMAYAAFAEKREFVVCEPETELDFMDTRDAGEAVCRVALSPYAGVVNIGRGVGVRVGSMVTFLADIMGVPACASLARWGRKERRVADISILRDMIGFSSQYDWTEMLQEVVRRRQCQKK